MAVLYGEIDYTLDNLPKLHTQIEIKNARMILRCDEKCGGFFGLAANGPRGDTRITSAVSVVPDIVRQCIPVSDHAAEQIDGWDDYVG